MTTTAVNFAAQERMTPDDYVVTAIARDFAARGELSFERFLSGYYAESLRIIHDAHLTHAPPDPTSTAPPATASASDSPDSPPNNAPSPPGR
ncbi:hypothetical protein [Micromonospora sp. LA-10]|uniref:hypothetical protein n=1 Tax=Micromonospora sp. LA-10 TaxID=3446364 RepID=UPI003F713600